MTSLQGKVALVTGSSSGIGEAIAIKFSSLGAKVTICGRDQNKLRSVFDKIVKVNGGHADKVISVQGDVNDQQVRINVVAQTMERFGRLDILVANAGVIGPNQSVSAATEELFDNIMDTNLKSVFFLIQQAVPYLEKFKGNIVCMSSDSTSMAFPGTTIYSMSKTALDQLTRCLAVDLGPKGIRVNGVNPGFVSTQIMRQYGDDIEMINKAVSNIELVKQTLNTRPITADDVAEAVTFLASDAAGVITGQNLIVDCGRCLTGPLISSDINKNETA